MNQKKHFVLDTSVLIYDPLALVNFGGDNDLFVPIAAVEELDNLKNREDLTGLAARDANRILDIARGLGAVRERGASIPELYRTVASFYESRGQFIVPKPDGQGGVLRILQDVPQNFNIRFPLDKKVNDDRILLTGIWLSRKKTRVSLVTKDAVLRIRSEVYDLKAEDLIRDTVEPQLPESFQGYRLLTTARDCGEREIMTGQHPELQHIAENEFAVLQKEDGSVDIFQYKNRKWHKKQKPPHPIYGQKPMIRNGKIFLEQTLAFYLLQDPSITCVCLTGEAGTGKSHLVLAKGLENAVEKELSLKIFRPLNSASEEEVGFLPGTIEEKTAPWYGPVHDILKSLTSSNGESNGDTLGYLTNKGLITNDLLIYIRGATYRQSTVILDEAQNTSPYLMRLFTTRIGEGTRLFITGDLYQASDRYAQPYANGLSFLISSMRGSPHFAHLMLKNVVRSPFAQDVADRLKLVKGRQNLGYLTESLSEVKS